MPEIPPNIDIPSGGGSEEIPTMEDYIEKEIEGEDEFTLDREMGMDGLFEHDREGFQEMSEEGEEERGLEEDITEEHYEEGEEVKEEVKEDQSTQEDEDAKKKEEG